METRDTFVVTLFYDPARSTDLRGRVHRVANNRKATFRNLAELGEFMQISLGDVELYQESHIEEEGGNGD